MIHIIEVVLNNLFPVKGVGVVDVADWLPMEANAGAYLDPYGVAPVSSAKLIN
jgi:hypothetical protein